MAHLLLETEAPYFLPKKITRTGYNQPMTNPGHVIHTAAQIAALKNITIDKVLKANRKNIEEVYKIKTDFL